MSEAQSEEDAVFYLVGGGIASLAAAAFLIRDGGIKGHNIQILEESDRLGGSLDAAGSSKNGYVMRGGRMIESKYLCTYDLFSSIPTLDERQTVTQEIFEWNEDDEDLIEITSLPGWTEYQCARIRTERAAYPDHGGLRVGARGDARSKHYCGSVRRIVL